MKKSILVLACLLSSSSVLATQFSEQQFSSNAVLRPITLADGMLKIGGFAGYIKELDEDERFRIGPQLGYGVTDNFTIGFDGLTYRFYHDNGLQLAINGGFRAAVHSNVDDTSDVSYGVNLFGKKAFNDKFALTFAVNYLKWDRENRADRHEVDGSLGIIYQLAPEWSLNAGFTYRDLSDYAERNANVYHIGLNRSFGNDFEVGLVYAHSDYNEPSWSDHYQTDFDTVAGVNAVWRF